MTAVEEQEDVAILEVLRRDELLEDEEEALGGGEDVVLLRKMLRIRVSGIMGLLDDGL